VILNYNDIREAIPQFMEVYETRPLRGTNRGGMMLPHLFATWYMIRQLAPKTVVESGVFKGLGTWLIEQVCDNVHSIDIKLSQREYISRNVKYYDTDFTTLDFPKDAVIFFDDHQNALDRVRFCKKRGYKHLIFEDNYPVGHGNCISLKQNRLFRYRYLKEYVEFPPVFRLKETRWNTVWDGPEPILTEVDETNEFYTEAYSYTWICYAKI